ncbi:MAG: PTS IIA-like nitrogen regulatory protein PtsN [Spongiibacteraceae bacterium]|nr:PTS IIA-like nitrogen regulatory protein PtsN [Spongiibacteraceae bacterium]
MQIQTILSPERTLCGAPGNSKKRVLENIAHFICKDVKSINPSDLFGSLITRERLGSTGIGHGIAIPHCRIKNCPSIIGGLIKLNHPIDFDAIDNEKVDLLFVLLVPEQAQDEHLTVLATLAELFTQSSLRQRLRDCANKDDLYQIAITGN